MSSRYVDEIGSVQWGKDTNLFCIITFINQPFETSWPRSTTRRLIVSRCLHFTGERAGVSDRILRGKRLDLPLNAMPQESMSCWSKFITLLDEKAITMWFQASRYQILVFTDKWRLWIAVKKNKYLAYFCFYREINKKR